MQPEVSAILQEGRTSAQHQNVRVDVHVTLVVLGVSFGRPDMRQEASPFGVAGILRELLHRDEQVWTVKVAEVCQVRFVLSEVSDVAGEFLFVASKHFPFSVGDLRHVFQLLRRFFSVGVEPEEDVSQELLGLPLL